MRTLISTIALTIAVAAGSAQAQKTPRQDEAVDSNILLVQNNRKVAVTVFMDYGDFDRRLGVVPAGQTAPLPLPLWALRDHTTIALFAHPDGEPDLGTEEFALQPGKQIDLIVPASSQTAASLEPCDTMSAMLPPEDINDATITVNNPRPRPVTVYAEAGQFDVRLGEVPARGESTLRFPNSVVGADEMVQIFIHPEGGFDLGSETLHVAVGQHLGLRVPID